jgi:aspartate carbamoyltransferase catalytic subunit
MLLLLRAAKRAEQCMNFLGAHVLSIDQFELAQLCQVMTVAQQMEQYAGGAKRTRVLEGAILGNLFFEPSTRTRISFGAAFNRLGGTVRDTTGLEFSSIAKGESLWDTARVLSGYVDAVVVRHPRTGAVAELARGSSVPVFNGGDGAGEHPTQALLDLYTISKELGRTLDQLGQLHITIIGDLKNGRAVHSLLKALCRLPPLVITLVAPSGLALPADLAELARQRGHTVRSEEHLETALVDAQVVYVTRLQRERFPSEAEAANYLGRYQLDRALFQRACRRDAIIMHPLPRDSRPEAAELANDLNDTPNLAVFRETDNGIPIRMALFALALGVEHTVHDYVETVPWRRSAQPALKFSA